MIFNSNYWRLRADEARQMAGEMRDHAAYIKLNKIADGYDEIAELARANELSEHAHQRRAEIVPLKG